MKTLKINSNEANAEINEKWEKMQKSNQRMVILKEELTCAKKKLHKTDNANNYLTNKRELLKKNKMETLQEAGKKLWVSQKALETTTEAINYE